MDDTATTLELPDGTSRAGDRRARALRDPARDRRAGPDAGAGARVPAVRRPPADRGRTRPREDADDQDRGSGARRHVPAHPVHARPRAERPRWHPRVPTRHRDVRHGAGPVFCNFLLADEINRAPAKVQSALLEVMQEHQVTIGRETHAGPRPVPRHGDAEPDRVRGHVPAPGGAGRPLHAEGRRRLSRRRGRADRRRAGARPSGRGAERRRRSTSSRRCARRCSASTSIRPCRATPSRSRVRPARPRPPAFPSSDATSSSAPARAARSRSSSPPARSP